MKVKFSLSIGFSTAKHTEIVDFDDDATDEEIEECYNEWKDGYIDGGWTKV